MAHLEGPHWEVEADCRQREIEPGSHAFLRLHGCSALGFPSEGRIAQSKPNQWADTKGPNSFGLGFGMGPHAIRKGCSDVLLLWENGKSTLTTAEDVFSFCV